MQKLIKFVKKNSYDVRDKNGNLLTVIDSEVILEQIFEYIRLRERFDELHREIESEIDDIN